MNAEAEWEMSLKEREIARHSFMTLTLAIAFLFVCKFAEEDDFVLWAKFLMRLQSILKTCSKISQGLPSARKIWRSMRESRALCQMEALMKEIRTVRASRAEHVANGGTYSHAV